MRRALETYWADVRPYLEACGSVSEALEKLSDLIAAENAPSRGACELFQRLPAPAFIKTSRFRYESVNAAFRAVFGAVADGIEGKTDFEAFGQKIGSRLWRQDLEAMDEDAPTSCEERLPVGSEGIEQECVFLLMRSRLEGVGGGAPGLLGLAVDLRGANRIDPDAAPTDATLDAMVDAVALVDARATIRFANQAFLQLTQYPAGEAAGLDARALDPQPKDREFYRDMRRALARRRAWRGSRLCRRRDGGVFWSDLTIAPIVVEDASPMLYLLALRDVTAHRNLVDALQRSALLKSEFTAAVSHELRTPLTAIKEAVDLVAQRIAGPVNQHQEEFLTLARRNIDRLNRIIADTLDLSRLENSSVNATPTLTDLNQLVGDVALRLTPSAERAGFRVETRCAPDLPPVWIDPRHIDRALQNVIENALRHATPGPLRVTTGAARGRVRAEVSDCGPGIDENQSLSIFEPYVQLSVGPGRKVGGAGIGLSISKRLVEANDGEIGVESQPGSGSTFYLDFPALDEASEGDSE